MERTCFDDGADFPRPPPQATCSPRQAALFLALGMFATIPYGQKTETSTKTDGERGFHWFDGKNLSRMASFREETRRGTAMPMGYRRSGARDLGDENILSRSHAAWR